MARAVAAYDAMTDLGSTSEFGLVLWDQKIVMLGAHIMMVMVGLHRTNSALRRREPRANNDYMSARTLLVKARV